MSRRGACPGFLLLATCLAASGTAGLAAAQASPPPVPAWEVQIEVTGGLLGTGGGTMTMDSSGRLSCTAPARCPDRLSPAGAEGIAASIDARRTLGWPRAENASICADCLITTMRLRTRTADGREHLSVYSWSHITFAAVPDDVKRVYRLVRAEVARDPAVKG